MRGLPQKDIANLKAKIKSGFAESEDLTLSELTDKAEQVYRQPMRASAKVKSGGKDYTRRLSNDHGKTEGSE